MFVYALLVLILAVIGWLIYLLSKTKETRRAFPGYDDLEVKQKRALIISIIALLSFIFLVIVVFKIKNVKKLLKDNGWTLASERGTHQQYTNKFVPGKVTLPLNSTGTLAPATYKSMLKQMGLPENTVA